MWQAKVMEIVSKFGFPAVVIVLLMGFIVFMFKEHRKERAEWQKSATEVSTAINNNTILLNEMKGLFQGALQAMLNKGKG